MDKKNCVRDNIDKTMNKGFIIFHDMFVYLESHGFTITHNHKGYFNGQIIERHFISKNGSEFKFKLIYGFNIYEPISEIQSVRIDYFFGNNEGKRKYLEFNVDKIEDLCKRINEDYDKFNK